MPPDQSPPPYQPEVLPTGEITEEEELARNYPEALYYCKVPQHEDDNIRLLGDMEVKNRRIAWWLSVRRRFGLRFNLPNIFLPNISHVPPIRDWAMLSESYHVADDFRHPLRQPYSPWAIHLRILTCHDVFQNIHRHDEALRQWQNYQIRDDEETFLTHSSHRLVGKEPECCQDHIGPFCNSFFVGRRIVFSQKTDTRDPRFLTGGWLIVAYVWGESFEWLRTVDVRKLISFNNAYCIRGYARGYGDPTGYQGASWNMFYSLDRSGDSPPRSGTMHLESLLRIYLPPPDSQGISVTEIVEEMCLIMDTDWRQIIARRGEQTDW